MEKIGKLIHNRVKEIGLTNTEFARLINCHRTNVNKIYTKESIDTKSLSIIGEVLHYNFFEVLGKQQHQSCQFEYDNKFSVIKKIDVSKSDIQNLKKNRLITLKLNIKD